MTEVVTPKEGSSQIGAVDSFREAAPLLRRPFARNAVKFKIVGGLHVAAYIDARLVIERLNLIVPHLWFDNYEIAGGSLICRLTIDGITREDVGSGYKGKGLYSDALKRAAVKFGVGVSLYAIPSVAIDPGFTEKAGRDKKQTVITASGIKHLRDRYDGWLENGGTAKFGEVLDHGDAEEAIGDVELEVEADGAAAPDAPVEPEPLSDDAALALVARAEEIHKNVDPTAMPKAAFKRSLDSARGSMERLEALVTALEEMQS